MNKTIAHIVLLLVLVLPLFSSANSTFDDGIGAYNEEKFDRAADKFNAVIAVSPTNISAYFNYGLAKIKTKNYGEAIWGFEKVLKMQPSDLEAKEHIQECYLQLNPNHFWEYRLNNFQSSLYTISPNTWGYLVVFSAIILATAIFLFKIKKMASSKRIMLIIGSLAFLLFSTSAFFGFLSKNHKNQSNYAIIVRKTVGLHEKETVNEGAFVEVLDSNNEAFKVQLEDKTIVFISKKDVKII